MPPPPTKKPKKKERHIIARSIELKDAKGKTHSAARAELDEAMGFYESRASGLGLDLEVKVERAVAAIQRRPESWPRHKDTAFRKFFVERFPFTVSIWT